MTTTNSLLSGNLFNAAGLRPRVRSRTFYKRVALVFRGPPAPVWQEVFKAGRWAVRPLSFDGRFWVETTFKHGAVQTRVCREGYPTNDSFHADANENPDMPMQLMSQGLHVVEFKVHNRMQPRLSGRVWSGLMILVLAYGLSWVLGMQSWYVQAVAWLVFALWAKVVLKGGVGNTGVAKQLAGVTVPWILTPYQLVRHIEGRKEVAEASGWSE